MSVYYSQDIFCAHGILQIILLQVFHIRLHLEVQACRFSPLLFKRVSFCYPEEKSE